MRLLLDKMLMESRRMFIQRVSSAKENLTRPLTSAKPVAASNQLDQPACLAG